MVPLQLSSGTGREKRRRQHPVRARTSNAKRDLPAEVRAGREELIQLGIKPDHDRPRTRADCWQTERPCPFVGCRHHLYLDVAPNGSILWNFPDLEPDELANTCALDVAEHGGATLENVGELMNITRERIRQVEQIAKDRARARAPSLGIGADEDWTPNRRTPW